MGRRGLRTHNLADMPRGRRQEIARAPWHGLPTSEERIELRRLGKRWRISDELLYQLKTRKYKDSRETLDLSYADLRYTDLTNANLKGILFRGADLRGSSLIVTQLSGADFSLADLRGADFTRASFGNANLRGARIEGADFSRVDLRGVKGLIEVIGSHVIIQGIKRDLSTWLAWETGGDNTSFDAEIARLAERLEELRAFAANRRVRAKVFLSYSHADKSFVYRIYEQFQDHGVPVWLDDKDMDIGAIMSEVISEGIRESWIFLIVVTPASVRSKWVKHELDEAYQQHIEQGKLILPVLAGEIENENLPSRLRHIKCADFRSQDKFEESFALLCRSIDNFLSRQQIKRDI